MHQHAHKIIDVQTTNIREIVGVQCDSFSSNLYIITLLIDLIRSLTTV